jgi:hypothetical protein
MSNLNSGHSLIATKASNTPKSTLMMVFHAISTRTTDELVSLSIRKYPIKRIESQLGWQTSGSAM